MFRLFPYQYQLNALTGSGDVSKGMSPRLQALRKRGHARRERRGRTPSVLHAQTLWERCNDSQKDSTGLQGFRGAP